MATADLITQLKQDFDDVYAAGKAAGGGSGEYEQGYEDGKNSVADNVRYAKTITFASLNVFGKKEVELNFDNVTALANLFDVRTSANKNTTVEHLTINCSTLPTSISQMLYSIGSSSDDEVLKKVIFNVDTSNCTNLTNAFVGRNGLKVIDGKPLDFSANTQSSLNLFARCILLTDFRLVANTIKVNFNVSSCSLLSTETIQSIIDGLADLTDGTAQTLTLHATVGAKLTDEQKATITAKNWTLVY